MFKVSILIERGDPYGECDSLVANCKLSVIPRIGEYITIGGLKDYLVHKIQHSILPDQDMQFINIYVYKL